MKDLSGSGDYRDPASLRGSSTSLQGISNVELLEAWNGAIEETREPRSSVRTRLDPLLCEALATSSACLSASLTALLRGYDAESVKRVVDRGHKLRAAGDRPRAALAILPSTVPGVGLQPLLGCLALRLPVMMKLASNEPHFMTAFVRELIQRLPAAAEAIAIRHWRGGDELIESSLLADLDPIVAYGDTRTMAALRARVGDRLVAYGPKASIAVVSDLDSGSLDDLADRLVTDVALFEQRGCLSIQAVYTQGSSSDLAAALAAGLERAAKHWPTQSSTPLLAAIQQYRAESGLRGARVAPLPPEEGTVIVEQATRFRPVPGGRTIVVQELPSIEDLSALLQPDATWLQGVALEGEKALRLRPALKRLGISRFARPGELQEAPADWNHDGIDLLTRLAGA